MHSNVIDHQLKIYMYIVVFEPHGNYKPEIDNRHTQEKIKKSKHNSKDSHQITREKHRRRKELQTQPENNKVTIST